MSRNEQLKAVTEELRRLFNEGYDEDDAYEQLKNDSSLSAVRQSKVRTLYKQLKKEAGANQPKPREKPVIQEIEPEYLMPKMPPSEAYPSARQEDVVFGYIRFDQEASYSAKDDNERFGKIEKFGFTTATIQSRSAQRDGKNFKYPMTKVMVFKEGSLDKSLKKARAFEKILRNDPSISKVNWRDVEMKTDICAEITEEFKSEVMNTLLETLRGNREVEPINDDEELFVCPINNCGYVANEMKGYKSHFDAEHRRVDDQYFHLYICPKGVNCCTKHWIVNSEEPKPLQTVSRNVFTTHASKCGVKLIFGHQVNRLNFVMPPENDLNTRLDELINESRVTLFMKGNPELIRCDFTRQIVQKLNELNVDFSTFDILSDMVVFQGIKDLSEWPTYPQLYLDGEFVGGAHAIYAKLQDSSFVDKLPKVEA